MTAVAVTGHQGIPDSAVDLIRAEMADRLRAVDGPLLGITSLAAGADQLFATLVLEAGGALHVVIPSRDYESSFADDASAASFRALLARARSVETRDFDRPSEDAYLAAGHHMVDLADLLIAVWDGLPARGKGGTADIVAYAEQVGRETIVIWPPGAVRP